MNIVYVSNEAYAGYLGVSLYSLYESNKEEENLEVYIISTGIGKNSRERLFSTAKIFKRKLHIIDFSDIRERFKKSGDGGKFDISAMGRLFAGELLPQKIKRLIYLDCDTIVLRPLKRLWKKDLRGNLLAAVLEPTVSEEMREDIGLGRNWKYFNSGVLLIDMERWRREGIKDRILAYYENIRARSIFADQDAINGALAGRIAVLSPEYNFFSNYKYWKYEELLRISPYYRIISKQRYESARSHPVIIHFAGEERPWNKGCMNYYKRAYDKYKERSLWKGEPDVGGKRLFMLAYHVMNRMTLLFPDLRKWISKKYLEEQKKKRKEAGR
ncbi:MAG: glycosyltransferase family 8 protein [Johnsonella sp.]|nr:glycosyltransferase family 8 protein [Johnsonella sp.]